MTQIVTRQVRQAIMAQLYTNSSFNLPYQSLLALGWSLLFHQYLPMGEALGWLLAVQLVTVGRLWRLHWRQPRLAQTPPKVLERELVVGITITSVVWAYGVVLYMGSLPLTYRAAMVMIITMQLTAGAIMLFGSVRALCGALLPLGIAMLVTLGSGNPQEQIVCGMLAVCLFIFLPALLRQLRREQLISLSHRFTTAEQAAQLKVLSDQLRRTSNLDGLTGIANRACFDDCLTQAWYRSYRTQAPLSLVLIDVDYFKQFNDVYGHQVGDDCLQQLAGLLAAVERREDDLAARYGGEEFALLLPYTHTQGALQVAENVRLALKARGIPHENSQVSSYVTCSFGVATVIPDGRMKIADLIQKADAALYQAKHNGRDRIEVALIDKVA
ncbi:MAG: diguanylate cyclase domain-containing protein [Aeromonas sp.]